MTSENIFSHAGHITPEMREKAFCQRSACLWMTGLSGSGKSTLAYALEKSLHEKGVATYVLDGDNVRKRLNRDLGFSDEDRKENIRRFGEVARLFTDAGLITIAALISPFRTDRQQVRDMFPVGKFIEVFVKADFETCRQRDPKGLYQKANVGKIADFTGMTSRYEEPQKPELTVDTTKLSVDDGIRHIVSYLSNNGYFTKVNTVSK